MKKIKEQDLLNDKRVVEEINRHLWIESEKTGQDIGFEKATTDWLENFSKSWMQYYMPGKEVASKNFSKKPSKKAK